MGKLEQYIIDNHSTFDTAEPPAGHFERFEARLPVKTIVKSRGNYLRAAALILVLISLGAFLFETVTLGIRDRIYGASEEMELPSEVREAMQYYDNKTTSQIASLCQHIPDNADCQALSKEAMNEINILDKNTEDLKLSLAGNPGNEKIIDAILRNQQMKEAMLSNIIESISKLKN